MSKITGINHITFATKNLNVAIEFYSQVLGAKIVAEWDSGAYLLLGNLWLCLSYDEQTKLAPNKEYSHIAFHVEEKDFDQLALQIERQAITVWKTNQSEGESLYILDPDFNKLEIHASNLKNRISAMIANPYPGMKLNDAVIDEI